MILFLELLKNELDGSYYDCTVVESEWLLGAALCSVVVFLGFLHHWALVANLIHEILVVLNVLWEKDARLFPLFALFVLRDHLEELPFKLILCNVIG